MIMIPLILCLALFVVMRFRNDARIPYEVSTEGIAIPTYDEIVLPFAHNYVKPDQIQATGGAAFNLDDGAEELFIAGGQDQDDVIYRLSLIHI